MKETVRNKSILTRPSILRVARRIFEIPVIGTVAMMSVRLLWKPWGTVRLKHAYNLAVRDKRDIRLHLGAGPNRLEGWLNTDIFPMAPFYLDATRTFPFRDNSISLILCEQFVEHVEYEDVFRFIQEAFRVLVPGGTFRIATPCLEMLTREYLAHSEKAERMLERNLRKGYDYGGSHAALLNKAFYADGHVHIYDYESLSLILEDAGFNKLVRCNVGESSNSVLQGLERHDVDTIHDDFTLVVEATKD